MVCYPVPGGRWARGPSGRKVLQQCFSDALSVKPSGDGADLFSILCDATDEDGKRFSDTDVVNHMIFLMTAAHDTSTITATSGPDSAPNAHWNGAGCPPTRTTWIKDPTTRILLGQSKWGRSCGCTNSSSGGTTTTRRRYEAFSYTRSSVTTGMTRSVFVEYVS